MHHHRNTRHTNPARALLGALSLTLLLATPGAAGEPAGAESGRVENETAASLEEWETDVLGLVNVGLVSDSAVPTSWAS